MQDLQDVDYFNKKLQDIKKKEYYSQVVKKKNMEIMEEKKNKTLWRLEKIDLRSISPVAG